MHTGLGTSSILGGVIMAALWRAVGQKHSSDSLIHAVRFCINVTPQCKPVRFYTLKVLHLEQMLTTGGGWQDQCGGLYGGLKISWSDKKLPVRVQTRILGMKSIVCCFKKFYVWF